MNNRIVAVVIFIGIIFCGYSQLIAQESEPVAAGLASESEAIVPSAEAELWEMMRDSEMISDEQYQHVLSTGQLPDIEQSISTLPATPKSKTAQRTHRKLGYQERRKQQKPKLLALAARLKEKHDAETKRTERIAASKGLPISGTWPDGTCYILVRFDGDRPIYMDFLSAIAADTISTDEVYSGSTNGLALTGNDIIVGIWDSGNVYPYHSEFATNRVTNMASNNVDRHSTAVASIIMSKGVKSSAKGMAPAAKVYSYKSNADFGGVASAIASNDMFISNHSYGLQTGWEGSFLPIWSGLSSDYEDRRFGLYGQDARNVDEVVYAGIYHLPVWAVGNDRDDPGSTWAHQSDGADGGYDTIKQHQTTKNSIVVGAVNDLVGGYAGTNSVVMTGYSGWGPTDDGRIKPDIVANGSSIYAADIDFPNDYYPRSGTSYSSPSVAGSIALLHEFYQTFHGTNYIPLASTMKALVLHTADEAGNAPGPDYSFGWGLMNTLTAAYVITNDAAWNSHPHIKEISLSNNDYIDFDVLATTNRSLKITICWTDPPGPLQPSQIDPTNLVVVNDLDLRIISPDGGVTNMPWILDPLNPSNSATAGDNFRDNVEQVFIDVPTSGWYNVTVTHKGVLSNDTQDVSMIITGNIPTNAPEFIINEYYAAATGISHQVEWSAVVGGLYCIDTSTNLLLSNDWQCCSDDISPAKESVVWEDSTNTNATDIIRFYRIKYLR